MKVFIIDEAGFGYILLLFFFIFVRTNPLRHYAYSLIGKPAQLKNKKLSHNLTCTATISVDKVECIRFFSEGGTKNEVFEEYFLELVK